MAAEYPAMTNYLYMTYNGQVSMHTLRVNIFQYGNKCCSYSQLHTELFAELTATGSRCSAFSSNVKHDGSLSRTRTLDLSFRAQALRNY